MPHATVSGIASTMLMMVTAVRTLTALPFQELLDDIREGKVATVITKDQSRLGRNHIETGTYMEIFFPEHGVRYIAINDGYDSNEQSHDGYCPVPKHHQ